MSEQAVVFGEYNHLVGIETITAGSAIAVIMLTPGMLHNAGPYRLHVDIADKLKQCGISAFRFDLSGIGESLGVGSAGKSIDRAASETIQAMDYLTQTQGIQQFILFGLCSGADDSMQTALLDDRVRGVIALDGVAYKTARFQIKEALLMARKMLSPEKWLNKIQRVTGNSTIPTSLAVGTDVREFPETAEQAAKEIQQLVDKGVHLHFIYTGGTDYYNYARQFYDMLPNMNWQGTESVKYFGQMDHVIMLCEDRALLVNHVIDKVLGVSNHLTSASG